MSIKGRIKNIFNLTSPETIFTEEPFINAETMQQGLIRMKSLKIDPSVIIDVGAARGNWSAEALEVWPDASYHLIEPLEEQRNSLEKLRSAFPNVNYHLAVAGEGPGEAFLDVSTDLDGSGIYGSNKAAARRVPIIAIDDLVKNMQGNFLIKLDTHGYELPILKGAHETLKHTSLLVIEVYGFHISPTCLLFHELSSYLDEQGFRLIDIVDIMRRPGDNAFWQADAFYLRKDNPVFLRNAYAPTVS